MKNLTSYSALLSLVLIIASCNKNDAVLPKKTAAAATATDTSSVVPHPCDSTKLVAYVLYNSTGIDSFTIYFNGSANYTFDFPANGSKTVYVKPGTYSIAIPPKGNYSPHSFFINGALYEKAPGVYNKAAQIQACSAGSSVEIH
ncbi:hypothetical protein ACPPVU_08190 [Mucilaginibacter sp. McL0603]|uniref:hypothetical protein n=1 Tax=Mucilaginibacter sp. McL0603 TaxID=3415670 RepID=UPI003CF5CD3F